MLIAKNFFRVFSHSMKVDNYSNKNFKGYKNIIADNMKTSDGGRLALIAMELDNQGVDDLNRWKEVQQDFNIPRDNMLSIMYSEMPAYRSNFILNDKRLFLGEELAAMRDWSEGSRFEKDYLRDEKSTLKAYTFLAELTRRIMNEGMLNRDFGLKKVLQKCHATLTQIADGNAVMAFNIINHCALRNSPPQKTAFYINKKISQTMMQFFK